jgi:hypothetical protein
MLKSPSSLFLLALALLTAFGAGAITAARAEWGTSIATIMVENKTNQTIESITVAYTTCGLTRNLVYKTSEQHDSNNTPNPTPIKIVLCGEGSHSTEAKFANGKVMSTSGSYIEGGGKIIERITSSGIKSEFTRLPF